MSGPPNWPGPPPGWQRPPPRPRWPVSIAMVFVGTVWFAFVDFVVFIVLFSNSSEPLGSGGTTATTLAVLVTAGAFGGGGALCFVRSPLVRGFGIGLMIGWALLTIVTGGLCTGVRF